MSKDIQELVSKIKLLCNGIFMNCWRHYSAAVRPWWTALSHQFRLRHIYKNWPTIRHKSASNQHVTFCQDKDKSIRFILRSNVKYKLRKKKLPPGSSTNQRWLCRMWIILLTDQPSFLNSQAASQGQLLLFMSYHYISRTRVNQHSNYYSLLKTKSKN